MKDFTQSVMESRAKQLSTIESPDDPLLQQCSVLHEKLKGYLSTLREESAAAMVCAEGESGGGGGGEEGGSQEKEERKFIAREALCTRANSLKKAVKGVLDMTEKGAYV